MLPQKRERQSQNSTLSNKCAMPILAINYKSFNHIIPQPSPSPRPSSFSLINNNNRIIEAMMMRVLTSSRFLFGKFKQTNHEVGLLGQQPDEKGMEFDKFRRYFTRVNLGHAGKEMPNFGAQAQDLPTLERNEIETRILRVVRDLEILSVREVRFEADLRHDLKVDSLNLVALLTSIEHEFTTVFEDNVFQGISNLNEVVTLLMRDPKII